ncbi:MAG TPA: hypothetical protein VMG82_14340, partial [Candidatus Sulfotelmatobacter sp.]|nr:hypothetical protein [Candidatus Sulfotelmatobacter sp.]
RGVFTSVPDLKRKLMRYIRRYNEVPKTVKWKYFDPKRRIDTSTSAVTSTSDRRKNADRSEITSPPTLI